MAKPVNAEQQKLQKISWSYQGVPVWFPNECDGRKYLEEAVHY